MEVICYYLFGGEQGQQGIFAPELDTALQKINGGIYTNNNPNYLQQLENAYNSLSTKNILTVNNLSFRGDKKEIDDSDISNLFADPNEIKFNKIFNDD